MHAHTSGTATGFNSNKPSLSDLGADTIDSESDPLLPRSSRVKSDSDLQQRKRWYQKRNLRNLYILMIPSCLIVEATSGFDGSLMNGFQAIDTWDEYFGHPRSATLGLITSMYALGAMCALPFVPVVTDRFGRKKAIVLGCILMIIGALLQASSQSVRMFMISRFILGYGIPFSIIAASSLIGELSHPRERSTLGSLFGTSYHIGSISAALVIFTTYRIHSNFAWRIPSFFQTIPSLLQLSTVYFLPESPRWLIANGRSEEAYEMLVKYHAEGDETSEFVREEFSAIKETLELELGQKGSQQEQGWHDLFATPGMRRRVLICSFLGFATQCSGNMLISNYLARILDNVGMLDNKTKNMMNVAQTLWGFINGNTLALFVQRFRRRTIYLTSTISILLIFSCWTVANEQYALYGNRTAAQIVIGLIFLYSPAYNMGLNALTYAYVVEILPFSVRAQGISWFQTCVRASAFLAQVVDPIGMEALGWKYYLVYIGVIMFEISFIYSIFPETSGMSLEELAFLFEGDKREEQRRRIRNDVQANH